MMDKQQKTKKQKSPGPKLKVKHRTPSRILFALAAVGVMFFAGFVFSCGKKSNDNATKEKATSADSATAGDAKTNLKRLVGRWVRPDGGYVIEIRSVHADGTLDAGYYNPRPINVSRATATPQGDAIQVFVELYDEGYPGSTYTLTYDPQSDAFIGTYFQAALRQSFDVVFVRMK
jgi:hypothetical protein